MSSLNSFGRLPAPPDARDLQYVMRAAIPQIKAATKPPKPRTRAYNTGPVLDQGSTPQCFPAGTLVQRANGSYVPIEDLVLLDEVVTAEGRTGRVMNLQVRFADQMLRVFTRGHNHLRLTPEHPVLTSRGYVPARDLSCGDEIALTRFSPQSVDAVRVDQWLSQFDIARVPRAISRRGVMGRAGSVTMVAPMVSHLKLTPGLGRLFGLFLAEGWARKSEIGWAFNSNEADLIEDTGRLLQDELGIQARVQVRPNNCTIVVAGGNAWAKLFAGLFSTGCESKGLGVLAGGPEPFREAMLNGWLDGDGYARRTSRQGVTVSHRLVMDMFAIAQSIGYRPSVRVSQPKASGNVKARRQRWDLEFSPEPRSPHSRQDDNAVWRKVHTVAAEDYFGPVYNLHVEGDESYVAEGIGVHNCVGYSARSFLDAAPIMSKPAVGPSATSIYRGAQGMDEWPGSNYDGTSVRGGMKFLTSTGQVSSYVWGQSVEEAINWMNGGYGTCLVGTNWYVEMSDVDKDGFMREPAPSLTTPIGGHAWHWIWYDVKKKGILMKQSWGHEFGFLKGGQPSGYAYLTVDFAKRLLFEDGEISAPVQILIKPTRVAA